MKKLLCTVLAAMLLFACTSFAFGQSAPGALSFRADGTFRILQISDPQDDAYPAWDMQNLLRTAIGFSDPDLIVLTGDIVEDWRVGDVGIDRQPFREGVAERNLRGDITLENARANVETAVEAVFSVFEEYAVPYVIALGNNDRKVGLSTADWLEIFAKYPHCVAFDESPDAQEGLDYHVTVKGSDGADRFNVWLMDTGLHGISDEQVDWYRESSKRLTEANGGEPVPALAFQHIQPADIGNLFEPCGALDEGARKSDNGYLRLKPGIASGYNLYSYEPGAESYEFAAWKECGDVRGAFFGHQHVEGFSGVWNGIELGFTYGCEMAKTGPCGFRVFTLYEDDPAAYENTLYRYVGKKLLGNVKVIPETEAAGNDDPALAPFMRLRELVLTMVSILLHIFG